MTSSSEPQRDLWKAWFAIALIATVIGAIAMIPIGWNLANLFQEYWRILPDGRVMNYHVPAAANSTYLVDWFRTFVRTYVAMAVDIWEQPSLQDAYQLRLEASGPILFVPSVFWAFTGLIVAIVPNPGSMDWREHGRSAFAQLGAIRNRLDAMTRTGIVIGFVEGGMMVRLAYRYRLRNSPGYYIRQKYIYSQQVIAPPGTGKSVQLQTVLLSDWPDDVKGHWMEPCFVTNDPKGENFSVCAGWRSQRGIVFKHAWADPDTDSWNYLSPQSLPGGIRSRQLRVEIVEILESILAEFGAQYAKPNARKLTAIRIFANALFQKQDKATKNWADDLIDHNLAFLWSKTGMPLPEFGASQIDRLREALTLVDEYGNIDARRSLYYARGATTLIPDSVELHWRINGRDFLEGLLAYTVSRCELYADYYGEPSFAAALQFLTGTDPYAEMIDGAKAGALIDDENVRDFPVAEEQDEFGQPIKKAQTPPGLGSGPKDATGGDANVDMTEQILKKWIEEAEENGYSQLCIAQLRSTLMKPDKERGSVISTAAGAIALFKNPAIRAATMTSSYPLSALRGVMVKDPESGKAMNLPVSVFMVVPVSEAEALGRLTALYMEAAGEFLLSQDDGWVKAENKAKRLRPAFLLIDEFWTLPELNVLFMVPALGRGLGVGMSMYGQSKEQIGQRYKNAEGRIKTLASSCNWQNYLAQNDLSEAEYISKLIGNRTVWEPKITTSRNGDSRTYEKRGTPLMSPAEVMSLERLDPDRGKWGTQLVMLAGAFSTPIKSQVPAWFRNHSWGSRGKLPIDNYWRDLAFSQGFKTPGDVGAKPDRLAALKAASQQIASGGVVAAANENDGDVSWLGRLFGRKRNVA